MSLKRLHPPNRDRGLESPHNSKNWGYPSMPPVNTSASPSDVDNEATAELPVLDVAAYESTLNDPIAHTDTWVLPTNVVTQASPVTADATTEMPAITQTPTPAYDLDHSGTHEMPQMPKVAPKSSRKGGKSRATPEPAPAPVITATPAPIVVPPSPPLIEELRTALATAERRIDAPHERARVA